MKIVTLLTDFGLRDAYAGILKGVILSIAPETRIVDLSHEIPPQDLVAGALVLRSAVRFFPRGTIHLAVVDPGVGFDRDPVLVVTDHGVLVGPNNGLLHAAAAQLGLLEARRLDQPRYFLQAVSRTFHGRDIFAPVAAQLANGVRPEELASQPVALQPLALPEPAIGPGEICGQVIHVDHFGNLVTNVSANLLPERGRGLSVSVGSCDAVPMADHYAVVSSGSPVALIGSWDMLEIAVRDGSAARVLEAGCGDPVTLRR